MFLTSYSVHVLRQIKLLSLPFLHGALQHLLVNSQRPMLVGISTKEISTHTTVVGGWNSKTALGIVEFHSSLVAASKQTLLVKILAKSPDPATFRFDLLEVKSPNGLEEAFKC